MLSTRQLSRVSFVDAPKRANIKPKKLFLTISAILTSGLFFHTNALAEEVINLDPVAVTGNPLGVDNDELVTPVTVINGRKLNQLRGNTLGETLNGTPGVSANSFGPNASRPVIRGLDSERIRILENGTGILDVSSLSFDHAVAIDPLIIEQIDVVRGPAALLYGGNAVGGVVNTINHRIHPEKLDGVLGRAEVSFGGPASSRNAVGVIDFGNDQFAVHVDAFNRKTDDLDIPGFAVSRRENEANGTARANKGKLDNSDAQQDGAALGASLTFDNGYIGASYSTLNNNYGTTFVEDGTPIRIDLESKRWDVASEFKNLGSFIDRTKIKVSHTDYNHTELEGDEVGTTFKTDGWQGTFELGHAPIGNLTGVFGYQFISTDFSAVGEEAFVPSTSTKSNAIYAYEELPINEHKVTFGARFGRDEIDSTANPDFANAGQSKRFSPKSFAVGGIYQLNDAWSFATNLSHNERAPSYFELFADGIHVATGQVEVGDVNLNEETSNGIDAQLRWKQGKNSFSFGAYATRFSDFIGLFDTGNTIIDDGEEFAVTNFRQVSALFKGIEFQGRWQATQNLSFDMRGDYVHAKDTRNNEYLPRISPARLGIGSDYIKGNLTLRFDVLHAFNQSNTDANELATDGYTNISATAAYKLPVKQFNVELFAKANNLLDDEIRDHTSFLKDTTLAGERSILIGARADF